MSTCENTGCRIRPSFGLDGKKARHCASHRQDGEVNVVSAICTHPGCTRVSKFGTVNLQRCARHRSDGDIDLVHPTCEVPGCQKRSSFAPQSFQRPMRCSKHRNQGDINVVSRRCEHIECDKIPKFAQPGEKPRRCRSHTIEGDIDVVHPRCESSECLKRPYFGQPGQKAKRCRQHSIVGDVNVVSKTCSSEACLSLDKHERGLEKYRVSGLGLCFQCHIRLHPEKHTRITVRKEQFILGEIQRQIPELEPYLVTWDCPLPNQDCTKKKPDMCWKVKNTLIHLEVDENGSEHEDSDERSVEIHAASNVTNHLLIRFNPDKTSDGHRPCLVETRLRNGDRAYKRDTKEWDRRIPVLIATVREAFLLSSTGARHPVWKQKLFF